MRLLIFCAVLGAYEIEEEQLPSGLFVVEASDLLMTTVMHIYKYEGAIFICPREFEDPNALFEWLNGRCQTKSGYRPWLSTMTCGSRGLQL